MDGFSTPEKNKEAEWSEKSLKHMYILFPFFGLNWTLELGVMVLSSWESCASSRAAEFTLCYFEGVNIYALREILQFH